MCDQWSEATGIHLGRENARSAGGPESVCKPPEEPCRTHRTWTASEDRVLREMWAECAPASSVAKRLGRTRAAVTCRASNMGLAWRTTLWGERRNVRCGAGERAERPCLKCGLSFNSAHKGNRICGTCKVDEDWSGEPDFSQRRVPRRRHEEIDG